MKTLLNVLFTVFYRFPRALLSVPRADLKPWLKGFFKFLFIVIFRYPVAVIAVPFREMRTGPVLNNSGTALEPRLPSWASDFDTDDNSLWGDGGWRTEHHPKDWQSELTMMKWIWRNGGHHYAYNSVGCVDDPEWRAAQDALGRPGFFWRRNDGRWLYHRYFDAVNGRRAELFLGWNLFGNVDGRNKLVCTIRFPRVS